MIEHQIIEQPDSWYKNSTVTTPTDTAHAKNKNKNNDIAIINLVYFPFQFSMHFHASATRIIEQGVYHTYQRYKDSLLSSFPSGRGFFSVALSLCAERGELPFSLNYNYKNLIYYNEFSYLLLTLRFLLYLFMIQFHGTLSYITQTFVSLGNLKNSRTKKWS